MLCGELEHCRGRLVLVSRDWLSRPNPGVELAKSEHEVTHKDRCYAASVSLRQPFIKRNGWRRGLTGRRMYSYSRLHIRLRPGPVRKDEQMQWYM